MMATASAGGLGQTPKQQRLVASLFDDVHASLRTLERMEETVKEMQRACKCY